MPPGRRSAYSAKIATEICAEIAGGKLLPRVCKQIGVSPSTVFLWLKQHPEFAELYSRAKEIQCEVFASETLDLAERPLRGKRIKSVKIESVEPKSKGRKTAKKTAIRTEMLAGDAVDRSRLAVETRKWLLSKMFPKKYGDKPLDDGASSDQGLRELADAIRNSPHG
jgi:transposase-like protein